MAAEPKSKENIVTEGVPADVPEGTMLERIQKAAANEAKKLTPPENK
jgi:hypothetical protein